MTHPKPIKLASIRVPKQWGYEDIICNNEEFCGKILHFNANSQFSCHLHYMKREVFRCVFGSLKLMTINTEDASRTEIIMKPGDTIEIPRLLPHQITALEESEIIEFSTHHEDSDSFRMLPGDSQK